MWHQIALNKRRSIFVIIFLGILFLAFGAAFGYLVDESLEGVTVGVIALFIMYIFMIFYAGTSSVNSILGIDIYNYDKNIDPKLYNVVEEMCIASGLPKVPNIYILDSLIPNAFAFGASPKTSSVCVTKGLLRILNRDELQGVIAHEISHIINRDTTYLLYAGVMVNLIAAVTNAFLRRGLPKSSSKSSSNGIVLILILLFIVLAPIFAQLFYFSLSRKREFLADACAARFTRYPEGLASALEKISTTPISFYDDSNILNDKEENFAINNLFIKASCITPLKDKKERDFDPFSTHPSTRKRIWILRNMCGADYGAYNEAAIKATGKRIINQNDASRCKKIDIKKVDNTVAAPILAVASASTLINNSSPQQNKPNPKQFEDKLNRTREVDNLLWKLAGYTFIECDCNTKLKIPSCYKGEIIVCPHCKKPHKV